MAHGVAADFCSRGFWGCLKTAQLQLTSARHGFSANLPSWKVPWEAWGVDDTKLFRWPGRGTKHRCLGSHWQVCPTFCSRGFWGCLKPAQLAARCRSWVSANLPSWKVPWEAWGVDDTKLFRWPGRGVWALTGRCDMFEGVNQVRFHVPFSCLHLVLRLVCCGAQGRWKVPWEAWGVDDTNLFRAGACGHSLAGLKWLSRGLCSGV
jgi:hypothetical protein